MSSPNLLQRLTIRQFADRFNGEMVALGNRFRYFCSATLLGPEDLKEYLDEPVAALPPKLAAVLPPIQILLVPYLRHAAAGQGRKKTEVLVATEKPDEEKVSLSAALIASPDTVLAFAVKEAEVADYHYRFYRAIAEIVAGERIPAAFADLLRDEIRAGAHGEVDEGPGGFEGRTSGRRCRCGQASTQVHCICRQSFIDNADAYCRHLL